jgi:hypothetical protein
MRSKMHDLWLDFCATLLVWLQKWPCGYAVRHPAILGAVRCISKPDQIIGPEGDPYLKRWFVIPRNPIFNIYLHQIVRSDDDRALHDHPWANVSLVLRGRYFEVFEQGVPGQLPDRARERRTGSLTFRWPTSAHRLVVSSPCWSLFITGPRIRAWGFLCSHGWVHWKDFTKPGKPGEIGRGCG